jgi:hypothetical protein
VADIASGVSLTPPHGEKRELPGHCVNAGTLVLNYGEKNMVPSQKGQPLLSSKRRPHFQTYKLSLNEYILVMGSNEARNQK